MSAGPEGEVALSCSFCKKVQNRVRHLIAGPPGVQICDRCVGICNDILAETKVLESGKPARGQNVVLRSEFPDDPEYVPAPAAAEERAVRCSWCHVLTELRFSVPVPRRGWLCSGCLDSVRQVVDALERTAQ